MEKISPCGTNCLTCNHYGCDCNGCAEQSLTTTYVGKNLCAIQNCCSQKGLQNCGSCKQLPCQIWADIKGKNFADKQVVQGKIRNLQALASHRYVLTDRLFLAPLKTSDAPQVFKWASDGAVTEYLRYTTYVNVEDLYSWLGSIADDDNGYEFGFFLHDGTLIGSGGLGYVKDKNYYELGYNLRRDCWGKGYCTEAVKAIMGWARSCKGIASIGVAHAVQNVRSQRVIEKCGFTFDHLGSYTKFDGSRQYDTKHYMQTLGNVHVMHLDAGPYQQIDSGRKTIEMRLYDEKRQQIKVGDFLVLENDGNALVCKVNNLYVFDTFAELYANLDLLKCGYDSTTVQNASPNDMLQYYSAERQSQYGVVGIEVEKYCIVRWEK